MKKDLILIGYLCMMLLIISSVNALNNNHNFSDTNNNAYWGSPAGSNMLLAGTEANSTQYVALKVPDASYVNVTGSGVHNEPFWRFNFSINETNINQLKVNWKGYDNAAETTTCYIYNFTTPAWISIGSTPTSNDWLNVTYNNSFTDLINGRLIVACEGLNYDAGADYIYIDYVEVLVNYSLSENPVYIIKSAPTNTSFIRVNDSLNLAINGTTGIISAYVMINDSDDNITSIIVFNFTSNITMSNLSSKIDRSHRKSYLHNYTTSGVVNASLLIPRISQSNKVFVCPGAKSIDDVNNECSGRINIIVGETKDGMTLSTTTISGLNYYLLSNITGTGAGEDDPPPFLLFVVYGNAVMRILGNNVLRFY